MWLTPRLPILTLSRIGVSNGGADRWSPKKLGRSLARLALPLELRNFEHVLKRDWKISLTIAGKSSRRDQFAMGRLTGGGAALTTGYYLRTASR